LFTLAWCWYCSAACPSVPRPTLKARAPPPSAVPRPPSAVPRRPRSPPARLIRSGPPPATPTATRSPSRSPTSQAGRPSSAPPAASTAPRAARASAPTRTSRSRSATARRAPRSDRSRSPSSGPTRHPPSAVPRRPRSPPARLIRSGPPPATPTATRSPSRSPTSQAGRPSSAPPAASTAPRAARASAPTRTSRSRSATARRAPRSDRSRSPSSGPHGDTLTFSIANKPGWATFVSSTGRLYGTPGSTRVGTYSNITISVSDGQTSTSLGPFTITVVGPNTPPTISGTPPASVTAGTAYSFRPTARDADGDTLTFSIANKPGWATFVSSTGRLYGTPGSTRVGTYSNITISVSDGQTSTSLGPFTITVVGPNTPPTISGTPPASVTAGTAYSFRPTARDADGDTLTFSIANKPGWATFVSSTGRLYGTPGSTRVGTYSNITISVSDGQTSTSLGPFTITVVGPNTPPTISGTPPASVTAGTAYSFRPTARDADGDTLTFSIANKPGWATFVSSTGRLYGTPGSTRVGTYSNITISVSDGQTSTSLGPFTITVVGPNTPPTISGTPPASVTAGTAYSFRPTARDADGDTLTFSIANKPGWATFVSSTGRLYGTPGSTRVGTYSNITISVSDGQTSTSLGPFTITVVGPNTPPTISGTPPASVTAGTAYSFRPTARDADGDTLTFSIANKPGWATFVSSTGRLYGTPGSTRVGTYSNITISVSDGQTSTSLGPFTITVVGPNTPPTISGTPPASVTAGTAYSFRPTARDADGDTLTFSIANKPGWATFVSSTGRLYGTPGSTRVGTYSNITISVSDGQTSTSLGPFTITVVGPNTPPTISGTPPASVTAGTAYSFRPTARDADGDTLTFSIANKPGWATFVSSTGRLYGTPGSTRVGTYSNITISVSDGQTSTSLGPFTITVVGPNTPPTISGTPPASVTAGTAYSFRPTARDADGDTLTFSIANKPGWATFVSSTGRLYGTPGSTRVGTYSNITISVSDGQTSTSLGPFTITVVGPNTPPTISGTPPASVTAGTAYSFRPTARDADGDTLTFSIANKPGWATFVSSTGRLYGTPGSTRVGTYSNITISVSDGQTSTSLGPFTITVVGPNTPPTISGTPPASVTAGTAYSFRPTARDADGDTLTFSIANKPGWATFVSSTGRLYGTPGSTRVGTYSNITISVSDGQTSTSLGPFTITVVAATTGSATVSWSPPTTFVDGTPIRNLAGYRVVYGTSPSALSSTVAIPSPVITSTTIEALTPGTWYFAVKAYTTAGVESDLSTVVFKVIN
jgi:hypothetical protein